MLEQLQQIGMSVWLPRGTIWIGHCSLLRCIKPVSSLTSPELCKWKCACISYSTSQAHIGQAGRNAKVEVGARTPGVLLTLVLRLPAYATGAPQLRMTKY